MNKEFDIQQLVSYLTGNCSKEERVLVEQWIASSKNNMLLFDELKMVWDSSSVKTDKRIIDVDKAWADFKVRTNFEDKIIVEQVEVAKPSAYRKILYYSTGVAAMVIVVFGLYFLLNKGTESEMHNYSALKVQLDSPIILPDGSNVVMNKDARINYPEVFASNTRNVNFKGEAFFNIAHNPDKPMIIATGNVRVKVLGTSFDLCNNLDYNEITCYLESGKVLFYSIDELDGSVLEKIILYPGQKGVYNKSTGIITKYRITDNNHVAWKTGTLEFVKAPLQDVIKVLERTYRLKIISKIDISSCQLTARFDDETISSIFESLQIIYGFNYKIEDNLVVVF